jgi:hypothetical protein
MVGPKRGVLGALACMAAVLVLTGPASASAATTGTITRADASADWKTGSVAGSITSDFCTPAGCSARHFWWAGAYVAPSSSGCGVEPPLSPPGALPPFEWSSDNQLQNGTVSFDYPDAPLLGTPGQKLCLYAVFVNDSCIDPPPLCFPTEGRTALTGKDLTVLTMPPPACPPVCPPPPPPKCPPACDVVTFSVLKVASSQKLKKLAVRAALDEPGTISVTGTVSVPNASKVYKLKAVTVNVFVGATMTIRVKLPKKALKAARRALRRGKKVKAKLTVTARDRVGNQKAERRSVNLKR